VHVNYEQMGLARAVLTRQADDHLPAMKNYLDKWATLTEDDLGLILQFLKPVNDALVQGGDMVLDTVKGVYSKGAENLGSSIDLYAETDLQAHALLSSHAAKMGHSISSSEDPRSAMPTLGAAGAGQPEIKDVQAALSTPSATSDDADNLRWEAGEILGSVDWVCEKLFGFSVLEEVVFKPFAGDWKRVECAAAAWENTGKAFTELAKNTLGLLLRITDWVSKSADNFAIAVGAMAGIDELIALAAQMVAKGMKSFAELVKALAKQIAHMLRRISHKLERIAAEASIPVAGWIVGSVEIGTLAKDVFQDVKWAQEAITKVCNFISKIQANSQKIKEAFDKAQKLIQKIQANYDKIQKAVDKVQKAKEKYDKYKGKYDEYKEKYDKYKGKYDEYKEKYDKYKDQGADIVDSVRRGVEARS